MKGYLSVTFQDAFGQNTVRQYELAERATGTPQTKLSGLRTAAQQIMDEIHGFSGARVVNTALVISDAEFIVFNDDKPETGSNISDDCVLSVALTGGGKGYMRIPAPSLAYLNPSGAISADNPILETLMSRFVSGGGGALSDGEFVDGTQGNFGILKTWRASRGRRNN